MPELLPKNTWLADPALRSLLTRWLAPAAFDRAEPLLAEMGRAAACELLEIGDIPMTSLNEKPTRTEALKYYRGVARTEALRVRTYTRLTGVDRHGGGLHCAVETRLGAERMHLFKKAGDGSQLILDDGER